MKNNKGVSLVEIIIVIAILSVLGVSTFGGIHYLRYGNAKRCTYEIDAALNKIRLENMSKAEKANLYIYQYGGHYYMRVSPSSPTEELLNSNGTELGNNQFVISYETSTHPGTNVAVGDYTSGNYMTLGFDKSTGELSSNGTGYYERIVITDRDGTLLYSIRLIQASGKHFIE